MFAFPSTRRCLSVFALVPVALSLAACGYLGLNEACDDGSRDWELVSFGVELPTPAPLDLSRLPTKTIEPHYQGPFLMVAQLNQGDFTGVHAHWQTLAELTDPNEQMRAVVRTLDALDGRGLAVLHQAQIWQEREPESPVAQLMLAASFVHAGREMCSQSWDPATTPARYKRMESRLQSAAKWLDPLIARGDIYGRAAKELNLSVCHQMDAARYQRAWDDYLTLIDFAPGYEWLYLRAVDHASPKHSRDTAQQRLNALQSLALAKGLADVHQIALSQKIEAFSRGADSRANPQAWRPYWEARVAAAPTVNNLSGWMWAELEVSNWPAVVDLSQRIIDVHPHHRYAWQSRSRALTQMGRLPEAYDSAMVAVTLGSDAAMNRLINGYVRGEMGLPQGDWEAALALCRYGALLALSSAHNCLGSSYTDGIAGIARDDRSALGWHLLAARGGHVNSQHDVGVLLPKVVTAPAMATEVDYAAGHWMRRAAVEGHKPASAKLAARPDWGQVCKPADQTEWWWAAYQILKSIIF